MIGNMSSVLVFDGDSISLGVGAKRGFTLADQTLPLLPSGIAHHVTAVGGRQIKECLSLFEANIEPIYRQQAEHNVIFLNAGDNDIAWGSSAEEAYDAIKAYVELAHRQGWHVVLSTKLQRYDWPETARSIVTKLNDLILENTAKAGGVADFQSDPTMNGDLVRLDRMYYTVDQIHPADAGYTILARIAASALLPHFPSKK